MYNDVDDAFFLFMKSCLFYKFLSFIIYNKRQKKKTKKKHQKKRKFFVCHQKLTTNYF